MKLFLSDEFICSPTWNHVGDYQSSVHSFSLWKLLFFLYRGGLRIIKQEQGLNFWPFDGCRPVRFFCFHFLPQTSWQSFLLFFFFYIYIFYLTSLSTDELAEEKCCHNGILKIPLAIADMTVLLFLLLPRWAETCHFFLPKSFLPHDADTHHFFFFAKNMLNLLFLTVFLFWHKKKSKWQSAVVALPIIYGLFRFSHYMSLSPRMLALN